MNLRWEHPFDFRRKGGVADIMSVRASKDHIYWFLQLEKKHFYAMQFDYQGNVRKMYTKSDSLSPVLGMNADDKGLHILEEGRRPDDIGIYRVFTLDKEKLHFSKRKVRYPYFEIEQIDDKKYEDHYTNKQEAYEKNSMILKKAFVVPPGKIRENDFISFMQVDSKYDPANSIVLKSDEGRSCLNSNYNFCSNSGKIVGVSIKSSGKEQLYFQVSLYDSTGMEQLTKRYPLKALERYFPKGKKFSKYDKVVSSVFTHKVMGDVSSIYYDAVNGHYILAIYCLNPGYQDSFNMLHKRGVLLLHLDGELDIRRIDFADEGLIYGSEKELKFIKIKNFRTVKKATEPYKETLLDYLMKRKKQLKSSEFLHTLMTRYDDSQLLLIEDVDERTTKVVLPRK